MLVKVARSGDKKKAERGSGWENSFGDGDL
jgi:hypothetical protein